MSSDEADMYDVSDNESAHLSPSDGTFGQRRFVPEEMVIPNPTHSENAQANKEREAREEEEQRLTQRAAAAAQQPGPSSQALSPRASYQPYSSHFENIHTRPIADDQASVMTHPPPAYSDIAASINGASRPPTIYQTMAEAEPFFPSRTPQDLGGYPEQQPLLGARPDKRPKWDICRFIVKVIVVLGGLALIAFIVTAVKHPTGAGKPMLIPLTPGSPRGAPRTCPRATLHAKADLTLKNQRNIALEEQRIPGSDHHDSSYSQLSISGHIKIKKTDSNEQHAQAHFDFYATDQEILDSISLYDVDDQFKLSIPDWAHYDDHGRRPCVVIEATLYVPDTELDWFGVSSEHLDIIIDDVAFSSASAELHAVLGNIESLAKSSDRSLESRSLRIDTRTGTVRGQYPLLDLLSITTTTGSVGIEIAAREAGPKVKPAVLHVETRTGSIKIDTPAVRRHSLPDRDYQSTITSNTGSLTITSLPHGSETILKALTSQVRAKLFPAGPLSETSYLNVHTNTGSVEVHLAPHTSYPHDNMSNLNANYGTTTGSVQVSHPLQWQGSVHAETMTGGSIKVKWPGLSGHNDKTRWPGVLSVFDGEKGHGKASMRVETRTGSIKLTGEDI